MNLLKKISPNNVKEYIGLLLNRLGYGLQLGYPQARSILVLAPHPDDDILGCGGTLAKHISDGSKVYVIYLADGSGCGYEGLSKDKIAKTRKEEAISSIKILGLNEENAEFWGYPDGSLTVNSETISRLYACIKKVEPDVVYLPFFLDNSMDHQETVKIFLATCRKYKLRFNCMIYEIWIPFIPNRLVDITNQIEIKKKAVLAHKSQIKQLDYWSAVSSLNKYRAETYSIEYKTPMRGGYAEAFLEIDSKRLDKLR